MTVTVDGKIYNLSRLLKHELIHDIFNYTSKKDDGPNTPERRIACLKEAFRRGYADELHAHHWDSFTPDQQKYLQASGHAEWDKPIQAPIPSVSPNMSDMERAQIAAAGAKGFITKDQTTDVGPVLKYDAGKVPLHLMPSEAVFAICTVFDFGAKKYSEYGWCAGMKWSRVFSATMRHLYAWWAGKGPTSKSFLFGDLDSETGYSHLWHAGCCIVMLICYEERSSGEDDRWTGKQ